MTRFNIGFGEPGKPVPVRPIYTLAGGRDLADERHGAAPMTSCVLISAPFSGIEVHFRLLERTMAASDQIERVDSIWLSYEPPERLSRLPPMRWNWTLGAAWSAARQLASLRAAGAHPDVALINHVNPALLLDPAARLPPVVLHLDTTPLVTASMAEHYLGRPPRPAAIERLKRGVYRRALRVPRHTVAVSHLVERSLINDYHVDPDAISVIPFTIDTDLWTRDATSPRRDDTVRVLFVGADWHRKGGDIVLDAARRPEFADCEFHVVTKQPPDDLPRNVVVHVDVEPNSKRLRDLFAAASIFVLPTSADLSPIVLAEAMAMELPIVATDVGAIPELVLDGQNGYIVPVGDLGAFCDRLRTLTESSVRRADFGRSGRIRAETEHSLHSNIPRLLDLLRRSIDDPARSKSR